MPLVIIRRRAHVITNEHLKQVVAQLPEVVAAALSCEEGRLTEGDIMIQVNDVGPFDSANLKDLNLTVLAHDYPQRAADLAQRSARISREVAALIADSHSWYVWVMLQKSSYGSDTMS